MKQIEHTIMGQAYTLASNDDGMERMRDAAQRVDAAMCKIRDAGKIRARERIAVLAALNLAYDLIIREEQQALASTIDDGTADTEGSARLQALLQRLDQVLAEDGRLL